MWLEMLGALALAAGGELPADPVVLYRVENPDLPGAVAHTSTASLFTSMPPGDAPYTLESLGVPDEALPLAVDTALLDAIGAQAWHQAGWTGQGVKVAIFDLEWSALTSDPSPIGAVASADCWRHPSCEAPIDFYDVPMAGMDGTHGQACAEVIRAIAPDAEIYLVRTPSLALFQAGVAWAIRHEIDVVSTSLSFFNSSFYDGTGPFADAVQQLDDAGILLVASAGNYALQHHAMRARDTDGDGTLDVWGSHSLPIRMKAGKGRTIYVTWDEYDRCGASDIDAFVYAPSGALVGRSELRQNQGGRGCQPFERLSVQAPVDGVYQLVLKPVRLAWPRPQVDIFALGGQVVGGSPRQSLTDPGSSPLAFTVGAVGVRGYFDNDVEDFSSQGPSRAGVNKPDIAGPDGMASRGYGAAGFYGTSAATPAVAGAVALLLSSDPALTPRQAADRLQDWAWRTQAGRHSPQVGAGKLRLLPPGSHFSGCGRTDHLPAALWGVPWVWWRVRKKRRSSR